MLRYYSVIKESVLHSGFEEDFYLLDRMRWEKGLFISLKTGEKEKGVEGGEFEKV